MKYIYFWKAKTLRSLQKSFGMPIVVHPRYVASEMNSLNSEKAYVLSFHDFIQVYISYPHMPFIFGGLHILHSTFLSKTCSLLTSFISIQASHPYIQKFLITVLCLNLES